MSNPYTQPSLSGYNASPPSDDGTETAANQLDWDFHLDKIGGPLKTFAEAIDATTLAAFGLSFGAAVLQKVADYTVAATDRGRVITVTGTNTITLLPAASAGTGFPLLIVNVGSGVVTIDGDSAETINGAATQTLRPADGAIITSDGAAWFGLVTQGPDSGNFTVDWTGFDAAQSTVWNYSSVGGIVSLYPTTILSATSDSVSFSGIGTQVPEALRPSQQMTAPYTVTDAGTNVAGVMRMADTGLISFSASINNTFFTDSGIKGFPAGGPFTYSLD